MSRGGRQLPSLEQLSGRQVLFVMALEAEYGESLRQRIRPLITGVGPIEAAVATTAALAQLLEQGPPPDLVVSLGSAGSKRLEQTRVYQASFVSWRDIDASALGFTKGVTPFLDLPEKVELPLQIPGIPAATLSTGANVVSGNAYDGIDADMVDMETFAVLRACHRFDVPLVALRGISDGADELRHLDDWKRYLEIVDRNLGEAVDLLADAIAGGLLD